MSFLPINEENQTAPTGQTTNAPEGEMPPQVGGSVGGGTAGGGAKGSATGTPTQFGSSASKLGDYLSSNAPQIGQQANKVAGGLNEQYNTLNQGINNVSNQFGQQVQGGYAAPDQNIVNQAFSNPTQFTQTPGNVQAFQGQYNNQYTGPQNVESFNPYSNIQGQVSNAVQQGNLLGSQAGLQSYLQGKGKNPTTASSTLDALLLRGNPEAQSTIQNAAKQFGGLTGQLEQAKTAGNQQVEQAKTAANQSKDAAQSAANQYVQNFGNQINQGAQTAEQQRQAYNNSQLQNYNTLTPIQQYLQAFQGGTGLNFENPLTPYLNQTPVTNPITAQNYATPEQYQQAASLQQLLGGNAQLPIGADTANLAGTAPNVSNFNPADVSGLIKSIMENQRNAAVGQGGALSQDYGRNLQTLLQNLSTYDPTNIKQTDPAHNIWNYTGPTSYNPSGV